MITYRQILKQTKKVNPNKGFNLYLRQVYRKNQLISKKHPQIINTYMSLLYYLQLARQNAILNTKVETKFELELSFISHRGYRLKIENDQLQIIKNPLMSQLFNLYCLCQIYYLYGQNCLYPKKKILSWNLFHKFLLNKSKSHVIEPYCCVVELL